MRRVWKCFLWMIAVVCMCSQVTILAKAEETDTLPIDSGEMCTEYVDLRDRIIQTGGYCEPSMDYLVSTYNESTREQLKSDICQALMEEKGYLSVRGYGFTLDNIEELENLFVEVINENPELFYVESYLGYSCYNTGEVAVLYFSYIEYTDEEKQILEEMIGAAISGIREDMTEVEKALVLHDYLAQNCAYAYKEYLDGTLPQSVFTVYGALVNKRAVCQGYALAYSLLLRTVGIESYLCTSEEMNHAWNVILIDGEWYHVDVTWDDPVWNIEGQAYHEYFLLSDAEMEHREHYGWSDSVECTSTKYDAYDYWWNDTMSQIYVGDKIYYINHFGYAYGMELVEKDGDDISVIYKDENWPQWNTYLSSVGDYFYLNDGLNLYAMHIADGTPQVVYTYDGGDGYIYGAMVNEDGTARLNISPDYYAENDAYITIDLRAAAPVLDVNYEAGTISTTVSMVYSIDGGSTWKACTEDMELTEFGWSETKSKTVLFKVPEADGLFESDITEIILKALPGTTTGKINCLGDTNGTVTIQLIDANGTVAQIATVGGDSTEYGLGRVNAGIYTMQISKENYVTREYTVEIGDEALTLDVEIHLIGDITGDGTINARDKKMLFNHISGSTRLENYDLLVGDISGDGTINARDKKMLYNHIAGISSIWE